MHTSNTMQSQDQAQENYEFMICDWACENRPFECKLKFSAEQKQIFMLLELYIPHDTPTLLASCWQFIVSCDAL